jgi:phosphatidylserine decarboxylase
MKIAHQGWAFIIFGAAMAAAGILGMRAWGSASYVLIVLGFSFAAFCGYFFRDPERDLPQDASKIYSPGDGTVLSIAQEDAEGLTVRIFLSIFNVHIQRLPVAGEVTKVEYKEGSFAAAMKDEAKGNERSIVDIKVDGRDSTISVEQIAGLIARRIRTWIAAGDRAVMGERYGLIQFGSQAAVHFPKSARPIVKPGDKVVGGVTPIGEWTAGA